MEQIEVISWKTLDALKQSATQVEEVVGDLDTNEQMSVFCCVEDDYLELYYSELEGNYIRHFDDEDEMLKYVALRKSEFGDNDYDSVDYYEEEGEFEDGADEDYTGFKIRDEDEGDEY
ncbi:MAG: hypothetical protein GY950_15255 [bacterium]|nr:hypothetical protein [bacterium]